MANRMFDNKDTRSIKSGLKRWGRDAYQRALDKNGTVSILQGNMICRKEKNNGKITELQTINQSKYRITRRTYNIKSNGD